MLPKEEQQHAEGKPVGVHALLADELEVAGAQSFVVGDMAIVAGRALIELNTCNRSVPLIGHAEPVRKTSNLLLDATKFLDVF